MGDGATLTHLTPPATTALPGIEAVFPGVEFTCGRRDAGAVTCWGNNSVGQLGDGTTAPRRTPGPAVQLHEPWQVDTGSAHACAIDRGAGAVFCWGSNDQGQSGGPPSTDPAAFGTRLRPVMVAPR